MAVLDYAGLEHRDNLSFEFILLRVWISVWFDIYWA